MTENQLHQVSELLKVLADPTRLRIILLLQEGQALNALTLYSRLAISQSLMSYELTQLQAAGLVQACRRGRRLYYSLTDSLVLEVSLLYRLSRLVPPASWSNDTSSSI